MRLGRKDALDRAAELFNRGDVDSAAWLVWDERMKAGRLGDADRLSFIDTIMADMRARLEGDGRLAAFEAHLNGRENTTAPVAMAHVFRAQPPRERAEVTAFSLGFAVVGASVILVGVFLPALESNTFATIEQNTMIQSGKGWWFVLLALLTVGSAYRAYSACKRTFAPAVFGALAIGLAIYLGTSHAQRRLCVSRAPGANCSIGSPGIGIYASAVGGVLVCMAGWRIFRARRVPWTLSDDPEPAPATGLVTEQIVAAPSGALSTADRLRVLDQLFADQLLSEDEYKTRRAALLDTL